MIYRVRLNGQNFLINFGDKIQRVGFYTTRDIQASSFEEAEEKAIETLRSDEFLSSAILNERNDSPMIFVKEIDVLTDNKISAEKGFTFYVEETNED